MKIEKNLQNYFPILLVSRNKLRTIIVNYAKLLKKTHKFKMEIHQFTSKFEYLKHLLVHMLNK